jgi:hypothetical protein
MKILFAIICSLFLLATSYADETAIFISGLSGRVIETHTGYRGENGVLLRTTNGYRATLNDGRIVILTRTAQGWNVQRTSGTESTTRLVFHRR